MIWTLIMAALVANSTALTIRIPERVEVSSDTLVLGDIAAVECQECSGRSVSGPYNGLQLTSIPLGYAPYAGQYRWLDKSEVENYLRRSGVDPAGVRLEMNDRVLVTRKTQTVPVERIREALESFLRSAQPLLSFSIESIEAPKDLILPLGRLRLEVDGPARLAELENLTLKVDFYIDDRRQRSQWVKVNLVGQGEVLVVTRDLSFGERIQPSDLRIEPRRMTRLEGFFANVREAAGLEAKRPIAAGEILTRQDVRPAALVRRGEVLTVLAQGKNFVISTLGRAREGGAMGEHILVENLESKQTVRAQVVREKTVQVQLAGGIQ